MRNRAEEYFAGVNIIVGTQRGDEAKGKLTDVGAHVADIVMRSSGGDNAGHTIVNDNGEFKQHLVPAGIHHPGVWNIIGSPTAVNVISLAQEITELRAQGVHIDSDNLMISHRAAMIMSWHRERDGLEENVRKKARDVSGQSEKMIGTTGKGIGPVYSDYAAREGFRFGDLFDRNFEERFKEENEIQEARIKAINNGELPSNHYDPDAQLKSLRDAREVLQPMLAQNREIIRKVRNYHAAGKNILGEGAQGGLLDITNGPWPMVTSSHPGAQSFYEATMINPKDKGKVIGVTKAYMTTVGTGPMPTELLDETGEYLQREGQEIGTTTGRKRRTGWFDAPAVILGADITQARRMALMKLDVLDKLPTVKICRGYIIDGSFYDRIYDADEMWKAEPVYEELPGWQKDTSNVAAYRDLPKQARQYVRRIEDLTGLPVDIISVGKHRDQTIFRAR